MNKYEVTIKYKNGNEAVWLSYPAKSSRAAVLRARKELKQKGHTHDIKTITAKEQYAQTPHHYFRCTK